MPTGDDARAWVGQAALAQARWAGEETRPDPQRITREPSQHRAQPLRQDQVIGGTETEEVITIIRRRVRSLGLEGASVSRHGTGEIKVVLPDSPRTRQATEKFGSRDQLFFYDWEPNLLGQERVIGGHPGVQPPADAIRKLEREWKDAGRNPKSSQNITMISSGAYPDAYRAALLAGRQEPKSSSECARCSVARPRYYLFEEGGSHKLLAGPELSQEALYATPTGETLSQAGTTVIEVPAGTTLVSELPVDVSGTADESAEPGWFALNDEYALSRNEITDPRQEYQQGSNEPNVTFRLVHEY